MHCVQEASKGTGAANQLEGGGLEGITAEGEWKGLQPMGIGRDYLQPENDPRPVLEGRQNDDLIRK